MTTPTVSAILEAQPADSPLDQSNGLGSLFLSGPRHWPTPVRLKVALGVTWVLALLFGLAIWFAVERHRAAMQVIAKDSAPSIIAAQAIKAYLADMHSDAANLLLSNPSASAATIRAYEERRRQVTDNLVTAAQNITYGELERKPIHQLMEQLCRYEAAIGQARILHEQSKTATVGSTPPAALHKYREADQIINEHLLIDADKLDKVNRDALERQYKAQQASANWATLQVMLAGGVLLATLAAVQIYLYRRMRRMLNFPLIGATCLTVFFLLYTLVALFQERAHLRTLKEDAFDSLSALWQARAVAFQANGDESRWLLDREQAAKHEKIFFDRAAQVGQVPEGMTADQLFAAVAKAVNAKGSLPTQFTGSLAKELSNITFAGEGTAAIDALRKWLKYTEIDREIRRLETNGSHASAVRLCLGTKPDESNGAFDLFDEALTKVIQINQKEFDAIYLLKSPATLAGFQFSAPLTALGIALLSLLGLRPRIREYDLR